MSPNICKVDFMGIEVIKVTTFQMKGIQFRCSIQYQQFCGVLINNSSTWLVLYFDGPKRVEDKIDLGSEHGLG